MKNTVPALYVHIPFCDHICSYCDFPKLLSKTNFQDAYLKRLILNLKKIDQKEFDTIFIGGGTPSSLTLVQLESLLSFIHESFSCKKEYSFEANPESLSLEKIKLLAKYGVNRVSLGVQSFKKESLVLLNRMHCKDDVFEVVKNLQDNGITNINLDFIFGLKIESNKDYITNIQTAKKLGIKHISYYSLQIEAGTRLFHTPEVRKEDDALADDYAFIVSSLKEYGYYQYEISNFALPGFESKHNLTYWHNKQYYGIGLGSTSSVNNEKIMQTRNITKYISEDNTPETVTPEDVSDREFNYLMLNLRLVEGFSLDEYKDIFHKDFLVEYAKEIEFEKEDLIFKDNRVSVKPDKFYILDSVLVDLLHFKEK